MTGQVAFFLTTGFLATASVFMVAIGFRAYALISPRPDLPMQARATRKLAHAMFWFMAGIAARSALYDVLRPVLTAVHPAAVDVINALSPWLNQAFHAIIVYAVYRACMAMWMLIPDEERDGYSIFGSVFYPHRDPFRRLGAAVTIRRQ